MESSLNIETKWYRLDNIAKIYPIVTSTKSSNVFRIAVNLKHDIMPPVLQQAAIDCKLRFPTFYVKLKKGLFWYYYEANEKAPIVKLESPLICSTIDSHNNNGYFFTFFYYKNRISLEVFHGICDGSGALEFLKAVAYHYLELLGFSMESENLVFTLDQTTQQAETEDSYVKNYIPAVKKGSRSVRAYRPLGTHFRQNGIGVINGKVKTESLKKLAKKHNATITQYLAALVTYCLILTGDMERLSHMPVNICIPVDMRNFYLSKTLRNFFLIFNTSIQCTDKKMCFEEILAKIKDQFASELNIEKLQETLNANVSLEKNIALKYCPLIIKWALIKLVDIISGGRQTTMTMSNLGIIELPASMKAFVDNFEFNFDVGNHFAHNLSILSCNGKTTIGFSRCICETELEMTFFSYLSSQGLEVEIQSNLRENY